MFRCLTSEQRTANMTRSLIGSTVTKEKQLTIIFCHTICHNIREIKQYLSQYHNISYKVCSNVNKNHLLWTNHVHSESCLSYALHHFSFTMLQQIYSVVILWTLVFTWETCSKKYLTSELVNWCAHDKLSCGDDSRPLPLKGQTQAMEYHFITAVFPCPVTATSMTTPFYAYCFNQLMVCNTNQRHRKLFWLGCNDYFRREI